MLSLDSLTKKVVATRAEGTVKDTKGRVLVLTSLILRYLHLIHALLLKAIFLLIHNMLHQETWSLPWNCIYFIRNIAKLVQCFQTRISPFSTYNISISSPRSGVQSVSEEQPDERWRKRGLARKKLLTRLLPYKAAAKNEKSPSAFLLITYHYHRPILSCVQQSFLPAVQHSDRKAQPYVVRHLFQISGILATDIQLWDKARTYGLTPCIIQRTPLPQREEISLQKFCIIKQQQFLKLFFRLLVWWVNPNALLC